MGSRAIPPWTIFPVKLPPYICPWAIPYKQYIVSRFQNSGVFSKFAPKIKKKRANCETETRFILIRNDFKSLYFISLLFLFVQKKLSSIILLKSLLETFCKVITKITVWLGHFIIFYFHSFAKTNAQVFLSTILVGNSE